MNNFLVYIGIIAQLTGLSLPQILEDNYYLAPNLSIDNNVKAEAKLLAKNLLLASNVKTPRSINLNWAPENILSRAAIVIDAETGQILFEKNSQEAYPIASITKVMTSLVFLENNPGWDKKYKITASENSLSGAKLQIDNDQELSKEELLNITLVGSANNTAKALARSTGLNDEAFAKAMNDKAKKLGLSNYNFVEPTGLDENNKISANDLAIVFREAMKQKKIKEIMGKKEYFMLVPPDNHEHTIKTTVKLLNDPDAKVLAGKTGFTYEAGYCLASLAENAEKNRIVVIVLGLNSETERDEESKKLINWTFNNYLWK